MDSRQEVTTEELFGTKPQGVSSEELFGKTATPQSVRKLPWYKSYLGLINPILGGFYGASSRTFDALQKAAEYISKKTGLPKGDAFKMLSEDNAQRSESLKAKGVGGLAGDIAAGVGGAAWDVPNIMALGKFGLPIHGGLMGAAEGGLEGAATGAATGALAHGALTGMGGLGIPQRVGAGAAFGAATTPGGVEERVSGAATMGALSAVGGRKRPGVVDLREKPQTGPKIKTEAPKPAGESPGINLLRPKIGPMDDQTIAVKNMTKALRATKKPIEETLELYKKVRGTRMGEAEELIASKGLKGEAALRARLHGQKNPLDKAQFPPVELDPTTRAVVMDMVENSPRLTGFERNSAYDGLRRLFGEVEGQVIQKKQVELLGRVFGGDFLKAMVESRGLSFSQVALETANIMRTSMSVMDLSMGFRQALYTGARHPIIFARNVFKKQVGFFKNEKNFQEGMKEIQSRKNHPLAQKYGLDLMDLDVGPLLAEEKMMGAGALEKGFSMAAEAIKKKGIPVLWRVPETLRRGIRASNRAYTGGLNRMRADLFDWYIDYYKRMKIDPFSSDKSTAHLMTKTASAINTMTGRGPIAKTFNEAAAVMNAAFFSPRLISSRVHLLNPAYYAKLPKPLRLEVAKTGMAFVGAGLTTLGLVKLALGDKVSIETDLNSSDALKIKVGKTRLDIWGGFQQYAVFLSRMITGKTKTTTGKVKKLGEGYKEDTRLDIAMRMGRYKLAPGPSFAIDLLAGESGLGEKFRLDKAVYERMTPMVWQDMIDILDEDPGFLQGMMGLAGVWGLGVQTHTEKGKKKKTKSIMR